MSYDFGLFENLESGPDSLQVTATASRRAFSAQVDQTRADFGFYLAAAEDDSDLYDRITRVEHELRQAGVEDPRGVLEALAAADSDDDDDDDSDGSDDDSDVPDFVDTDKDDSKDRDDSDDSKKKESAWNTPGAIPEYADGVGPGGPGQIPAQPGQPGQATPLAQQTQNASPQYLDGVGPGGISGPTGAGGQVPGGNPVKPRIPGASQFTSSLNYKPRKK